MKYIIEKLEKRNGDIVYRHKQDSGSFVSYSSTPTLQKYDLEGFRLVSRIENWRGSGSTVFQKFQKFTFDGKGAKKSTQPAIVYRTRAKPSDPWTNLSNDSTFPDTDPFYVKEVHEDNFSTKKLAGVASLNKPCIKIEDLPEEYHGEALKITPKTTVFEGRVALNTAITAWDSDPNSAKLEYGDIANWDVSAVIDMAYLFSNKQNTTTLDLSGWDMSNVIDTTGMFKSCLSLTSLDLSRWDTSNVKNMKQMFQGCSALTSLDVSHFVTSDVTNMQSMFRGCALTSVDVSNFDTSNVESMSYMFYKADSLTTLNLNNWNTSSLEDMLGMFTFCTNLTSVSMQPNSDNGVWNNIPPVLMDLFLHCENLTTISGIENWDTSGVDNMRYVFDGCKELTTLNISNWDVGNVKDFSRMFGRCAKLSNLNLSSWSTSSEVDSIFGMFYECETLTSLNLSGFDTSGVRRNDMAHVFNGCTSLSTVAGLSSWCVENIAQAYPPMNFATNAPFANTTSNLPNWGVSCDG